MVMSQTAADLYAKARQRRNAIEKGDKKKAAQYTQEYNDIASRPNSGVRGSNTSGFAENEYWDRDTQSYVPEPEPQPQHRPGQRRTSTRRRLQSAAALAAGARAGCPAAGCCAC